MSTSTWKWTESLTLPEAQIHLEETEGAIRLRQAEITRLEADKRHLEYRINKLRREAGELK